MKHACWIGLVLYILIFPLSASANSFIQPDVKPYIDQDSSRTMVPLRFVSEQLGAQVEWIGAEKTVVIRRDEHQVVLKIREKQAVLDGMLIALDPPALIRESRTFVPLRFVGEALGAEVKWVEETKTAVISTTNRKLELTVLSEENYENERFRQVKVKKNGDSYTITGEANVYEGVVQYVVEDGHYELLEGRTRASQAAPQWGEFRLDLQVKKISEYTTLMLVLFEENPKDGRRQYELPIPLP